MLARLI